MPRLKGTIRGLRHRCAALTLFAAMNIQAADAPIQPSVWAGHPDVGAFEATEKAHLAAARRAIDRLKAVQGPRTLENTLAPFDEAVMHSDSASFFAGLMEAVHPEAAFRDRASAMTREASAFRTAMSLDPAIYRALTALDVSRADAATRHYVTRQLLQFRLAGVDRDPATRARLKVLQDRITDAMSRFDRNINDGTRSVSVTDARELAGLPADFIADHKPGADGRISITTNYPDYFPVMQFANSDTLRRKLWIAFSTRAYPVNEGVLRELMQARHDVAKLLGYKSWADYNTADSMIGSGAHIAQFIAELDAVTRPGAEREFRMLLDQKRKTDPGASKIYVHERSYFMEQVRRARYDFDSQSVRPYFPYGRVKQGILDTAAALFSVSFRREADAPVWDPSVEVWQVLDKGKVIGRFYLDMHPRPGKFSHAEMIPIRDGVLGRQLPEAALVCNFPAPTARDPALMVYSDVETFFHEFGHLMHMILGGQQKWAGISGISMEADFVEAPSQMLEELIRSPAVLARFARHYQTNEPIPEELVKRMNRASTFGRASNIARQNVYTDISYEMYRGDPSKTSPDAVEAAAFKRYSLYTPLPGTHGTASFGHLGGYSSAYYTYMWDKEIALDFYSRFNQADPLSGDVPMRYRREVLEPGGSLPANDLVKNFLGRPQNMQAFSRWIGEEFADP